MPNYLALFATKYVGQKLKTRLHKRETCTPRREKLAPHLAYFGHVFHDVGLHGALMCVGRPLT